MVKIAKETQAKKREIENGKCQGERDGPETREQEARPSSTGSWPRHCRPAIHLLHEEKRAHRVLVVKNWEWVISSMASI